MLRVLKNLAACIAARIRRVDLRARLAAAIRNPRRRRVCVAAAAAAAILILLRWVPLYRRATTLALVNRRPVGIEEVTRSLKSAPDFYRSYLRQNPEDLLNDYINQRLLAETAHRYRWRYRRQVNRLVRQYREQVLVQAFVEGEIVRRIAIPQETIVEYYNSHLEDYTIQEKLRIHEIVVATQEEAENILNRLMLNENFESIAMKESTAANRSKGGDIGWIGRGELDPELEAIVFGMQPGQILGKVVKTGAGYHIIKVAARQERRLQTLEEAAPAIREYLVSQEKRGEIEKYIRQLRERRGVRIFPENLGKLREALE